MTITHQRLVDEDGNPKAALIPWEEFRVIQAELETPDDAPVGPEWKAELDRRMESYRNGTSKLIPHDEVIQNVREQCRGLQSSKRGE